MGTKLEKNKKSARRRGMARVAALSIALALGALAGCSQEGGSSIASPLASPKATGTPEHPFLLEWGVYGSGDGQFDGPSAVAVNAAGTTVYVADQDNDRIQAFSPAGGYLAQWPATLPSGLAVDGSGRVDVTTQDYVQEFDPSGNLLASGGGPGTQPGQLGAPQGLVVNAAGTTLFVAENSNQRVQAVAFLVSTPTPSYGITGTGSWGGGAGGATFDSPDGAALGPANGVLYVADSGASRVWGIPLAGGTDFSWGGSGPNPGQFNGPQGIAADPSTGDLYVADTGNNRIEEFGPGGGYLFQWGGLGGGNGFFRSPAAVAVDAAGNIYVADKGNNLIQKFGP